jgi:hypothetical protein
MTGKDKGSSRNHDMEVIFKSSLLGIGCINAVVPSLSVI